MFFVFVSGRSFFNVGDFFLLSTSTPFSPFPSPLKNPMLRIMNLSPSPLSPVVPRLQVAAPARGAAVAPFVAAPVVALAAALLLAPLAALAGVGGDRALHGLSAEVDVAGRYSVFFVFFGNQRREEWKKKRDESAGRERERW
jgi:hypothetical protein